MKLWLGNIVSNWNLLFQHTIWMLIKIIHFWVYKECSMQIFAVILWYAVVIAAGFYNATKTLAFASYFCKMRVKNLYWSPDGELIFSKHFHSITDRIFHFKIQLWFSSLLNRTIDSDIKVLNHLLLMLASDHKQKSKTFIQNFSLKINWLN